MRLNFTLICAIGVVIVLAWAFLSGRAAEREEVEAESHKIELRGAQADTHVAESIGAETDTFARVREHINREALEAHVELSEFAQSAERIDPDYACALFRRIERVRGEAARDCAALPDSVDGELADEPLY